MIDDPEGADVHEITLSYTFHTTDLPDQQAALDDGHIERAPPQETPTE